VLLRKSAHVFAYRRFSQMRKSCTAGRVKNRATSRNRLFRFVFPNCYRTAGKGQIAVMLRLHQILLFRKSKLFRQRLSCWKLCTTIESSITTAARKTPTRCLYSWSTCPV